MKFNESIFPVRIAALGLLAGIVCSWPLWDVQARVMGFPTLPLFDGLSVPGYMGRFLAVLGAVLIGGLALLPFHKILTGLVIAVILLFCLLDLNRLQPWVWFYLLIFILALSDADSSSYRALLAALYFWSGFHKLTPYFAEDNFQWFCSAFSLTERLGHYPILGYAIAVFEMSLASGLLWPPTRRWFVWLTMGLHAVILLVLSPLGHDWNRVVIPWNLAMMALVWTGFTGSGKVKSRQDKEDFTGFTLKKGVDPVKSSLSGLKKFLFNRSPVQLVVLALAWLAPALNLFGWWPHTLSWQLYTNTQPEGTFYLQGQAQFQTEPVQEAWSRFATPGDPSRLFLDDWAMHSIRVPLFPSERTFRQTAKYLCGCLAPTDSCGLYILSVHRWDRSAEQWQQIPCGELLKK